MSQQYNDASDLDHRKEIFDMVLVPNSQTPKILQPRKKALDLPASSVAPEWSPILGFGSFAPATMRGNHLDTPVLPQSLVKPIAVIRFVADQSPRNLVGKTGFKRILDQGHFMRRSADHVHGDRKTASVCHCHDLAALAPLGFANPSAPFFAGANVPSMKASRRSILPRSRRSSANAVKIRSKTPSRLHRWNQRWQVWYGGYRSGKFFHGAPVLRIQSIPSRTSRGSLAGLPLPPFRLLAGGIMGAISSHCSFVRSMDVQSMILSQKSRFFLDFGLNYF